MVTIWPDDVLSRFPFVSCLFLCSLGPLILSPFLFYFFFLFPLSLFFSFFSLCFLLCSFFFLCLLVLPAFFSCILSLFLRLCISFVPCPLLSSPLVSFCFGPLCSFVPLLVLSFPSSWPFSSFYKARECHAIASK
jgi:hypothetical protein